MDSRLIQTTAPISLGSSGGGLFDSSGELIGITSFRVREGQNLNFAIPGEWVTAARENGYQSEAFNEASLGCAVKRWDAVARRSRDAHVFFGRAADCAAQKDDVEGAIKECREWLQVESNTSLDRVKASYTARAHDCLGKMLGKKRDITGARAEFREAIRLDGEAATHYFAFADFLESQGQADEASLEKAQAYYCVGRFQENEGKLEDALAQYKEAHELDPLGPNILCALDRLTRNLNRTSSH